MPPGSQGDGEANYRPLRRPARPTALHFGQFCDADFLLFLNRRDLARDTFVLQKPSVFPPHDTYDTFPLYVELYERGNGFGQSNHLKSDSKKFTKKVS